jgi:hypothetical protein
VSGRILVPWSDIIEEAAKPKVRDSGLSAAQRVEHYEMAGTERCAVMLSFLAIRKGLTFFKLHLMRKSELIRNCRNRRRLNVAAAAK